MGTVVTGAGVRVNLAGGRRVHAKDGIERVANGLPDGFTQGFTQGLTQSREDAKRIEDE